MARKADKFGMFGGIAGGLRARRLAIEGGRPEDARDEYKKGMKGKKKKKGRK